MIIAGLQRTTLIDYPGKIACVVFLAGCSFRCGWCYNSELVLPTKIIKQPRISEKEVLDFLRQRQGLLEGVCLSVSGDEPVVVRSDGILKHVPIKELWNKDKKFNTDFHPIFHEYQNINTTECLTKNGFKKADKIIRHKTKDLYRIIASPGGYSITLTGSHSIFILNKSGFLTKPVKEIRKGDFIVSANYGLIDHSHEIKCIDLADYLLEELKKNNTWQITEESIRSKFSNKPDGTPRRITVDSELCEFLGYAAAEGCSVYRYDNGVKRISSYQFSLGDELDLAKRILTLYHDIFKTDKGVIRRIKSLSGKYEYNVVVGNILIAELINSLVGRGFINKKIPTIIFNTTVQNKISFIKALIAGDGYWRMRKNKSQEEFSVKTASIRLTADLVFLAKTLDVFSWVEENKDRVGHKRSFRIVFSSNDLEKLGIKKTIETKYFFNTRVRGIPKILIDYALRGQKRINAEKLDKWSDISAVSTAQRNIGLRFGFLEKNGEVSDKLRRINFFTNLLKNWDIKEVKSIQRIELKKEEYVYDLAVPNNHSFVGGTGAFLLHNTGGEPTINKDLPEFIRKIKNLGFLVKLDTNGSNPKMLKDLVETGFVDYVAMDIKGSAGVYEKIIGEGIKMQDIEESVDFLKSGKIDFEFRTTAVPGVHEKNDFVEIAKWIGGENVKYYLQNFVPQKTIDPEFEKVKPFTKEFLQDIAKDISPYFKVCSVRS